jgi:cytochrome c-type biogenesis protein CcmH/NrfF
MVAAGYDSDQITSYFVGAYGDFVMMAPEKTGFNLVVWLAPLAFFGVGGLLGILAIRRSAARATITGTAANPSEVSGQDGSEAQAQASSLDPWLERIRAEAAED